MSATSDTGPFPRSSSSPQTVAVLVTDLVGSTELLSHLGDAAYDELRRAHIAALRRAVDEAGGQQVKGTGDGILAAFGSAAAAIDCAVAIQQAVEVQARDGVPLSTRVAVALGDVSFEDGDVFGPAVVEADRLAAAAQGGQILATAVVRAVAGGRCTAHFREVADLELTGVPEAVAACEVTWEPLPAPSIPLPALLRRPGRVFVGRDSHMKHLARCWEEVRAGHLRGVVIAGEPGVGKTRLAAEFAGAVHAAGATVLGGRCDEDMGVPYQPFVEALRHLVDNAAVPTLVRLLGRNGHELVRLLPELGELLPDLPERLRSDPETERFRLFDAVAMWLSATSADHPVLLVLEDLQWAAKPTLLLLRHVLGSREPMRVLVVATYRDTEVGRTHPLSELLVDLRRLETVDRVSLAGLAQPDVVAFLEQAAGHPGEERDELAAAVHRQTEGNPLFVVEVVRHLVEVGALRQLEGGWTMTRGVERLGIPEGLRDVIGRRLARLPATVNRVLALAAVAGEEFELAVVERASELDEETLLVALDEAVTARLVFEVSGPASRYRFSHALVRATLYEELTDAGRVVLHRRVGEAIERLHSGRLDDFLPALAHHYARASIPQADAAKAATYAQRAGDRALAQLANDEAVTYYRQALEILDLVDAGVGDASRLELLISLGEAQRRAGDRSHRDTLLTAARLAQERGDAAALARAALSNNRGFFAVSGRLDAERVSVLDAAVAAAPPGDDGVRARLLANLAGELVFSTDNERRNRIADEALAMARRLGDRATLGHVLSHRMPVLEQTRTDELSACLDGLEAAASALRDPVLAFMSTWWRSINALTLGDAQEAARRLDAAARVASDLKQPFYHWAVGYVRCNLSRIGGELALAERHAMDAFEVGRSAGIPDAYRVMGINLFWIRYDQGRLAELAEPMAKAAAREGGQGLYLAVLAFVHAELERHAEAREILDTLAADGFATLPAGFLWLYSLTVAATTCAEVGDRACAVVLYDHLLPWSGLVAQSCACATGTVAHHLGLLAGVLTRYEAADEHFAEAVALNERIGAPTWQATTRLEWARVLLARGRRPGTARARELLDLAIATAAELGMGGVMSRAEALLVEAR